MGYEVRGSLGELGGVEMHDLYVVYCVCVLYILHDIYTFGHPLPPAFWRARGKGMKNSVHLFFETILVKNIILYS
jgi:hypothetical protein